MKFKSYYDDRYQLENDILTLLEVSMLIDDPYLNEGKILNNISTFMKKLGLSIHHREGLFQYLKKASLSINKLLMLAFKNDREGMKKHIQEMNISKADVLDVLIKLDVLTLHVISYPLHVIDAVTGWEIMPAIKSSTLPVIERAKKAIKEMEYILTIVTGKVKEVLKDHIFKIKELLDLR